jgi:capsular polysaccharide biosynthesis protein
VSDPVFSLRGDDGELDRLGAYDQLALTGTRSVDLTPGLVSLAFLTAAIKRSASFWVALTILGLVVGLGVYKERPHVYQATASVLLTLSPYEDSPTVIQDNQAIAETSTVAAMAVHQLGLKQSVSNFLGTYTALGVTDRVLTITANAPSANQAALRATVVANAFLKLRADELNTQQKQVLASLDQQLRQANQQVSSLGTQISQLPSQPGSATRQSRLAQLEAELTSAKAAQTSVEQAVEANQTTTQPALTAALKNSQIVGVTPVAYSKKKKLLTYAGIGLLVGLVLGLGIVIVRALVSDRLRRRDDIAYALDAPVKLSVGTLRARPWLPAWPGRATKRALDMSRVIAHLRDTVSRGAQGPAGLVIVAVDNAPIVARGVAAVAATYASAGYHVIAADLSTGADMARLLRVRGPGLRAVNHNRGSFKVAIPARDDIAPVGPLPPVTALPTRAQAADPLVPSDTSAELVLTLVTLDPALGGAYLGTWAANAVVVVTAGKSRAERIHGVGEMIRLAGTRLESVVVIGADKSDESLGLMRRPDEETGVGVLAS